MIGNINNNEIQDILAKTPFRHPDSVKAVQKDGADVSLQVDYAAIIKQAIETTVTSTEAVQQAKDLLLSGRLETTENFGAAANNMIEHDI